MKLAHALHWTGEVVTPAGTPVVEVTPDAERDEHKRGLLAGCLRDKARAGIAVKAVRFVEFGFIGVVPVSDLDLKG